MIGPEITLRRLRIKALAEIGADLRRECQQILEARDIELSIRAVLDAGYRTADLQNGRPGKPVSTLEMGQLVEQRVASLIDRRHAYHAV